jgi:opacity protein-like surface antigen
MNRTTWILISCIVLTSFPAAPALAAEPGFYLSAGLGRAEESPESIGTNVALGFPPTGIQHIDPIRVEVDESDVAWSVAVGYRINPYLAAEVEYLDFGSTDIAETYNLSLPFPVSPVTFTRRYSTQVTGPALSVLGTVPIGNRFDLFVRGGALFADREVEIPQSIGINGTTFGSTVFFFGAGADMSLAPRWALRLEYQRTGELDDSILVGGTELERVALSVLFRL